MSYYDEATLDLLEDYDDDESFYEDDYDDEDYDDDESFYEDDYDDEDYDDDEGLAESDGEALFRRHSRSRSLRGRSRLYRARGAKARRLSGNIRGLRRAVVRTPAGKASIRLPKAVVTKEELKKSLAKVGMEIRKNGKAITRLGSNIRKVDKSSLKRVNGLEGKLSKFEKRTKKDIDAAKQQAILPLLLQSTPKLKSAVLTKVQDSGQLSAESTKYSITNPEYESDDNTLLLLLLAGGLSGRGSGGLFGGGSNSLLPLLLIGNVFK